MDRIDGELWRYNLVRVTFVDVTEDCTTFQDPLPSAFYPVVREVWLPRYGLLRAVAARHCLSGYIYDWHEAPEDESVPEPHWYVGVVSEKFLQTPIE